jgi:hypothetical protein
MRGPLRCHSAVGIPVYLPVVYSLLYRLLGGHMVNFKSPVVAEQDFSALDFASDLNCGVWKT